MIENAILEISANTVTDAAILVIGGRMSWRHTGGASGYIARTAVVA
jgi:hypothetical protein